MRSTAAFERGCKTDRADLACSSDRIGDAHRWRALECGASGACAIRGTGGLHEFKQNLFFALVYNAAGVPVAAGLLYPFFGILISPIFAAAAMSLSSVSVITNALRLRRARI
jgi:hypothetical protein